MNVHARKSASFLVARGQGLTVPNGRTVNPVRQQGTVLVIVLWVAFGLVSLALYFSHSMTYELRASDNRAASIAAEKAIDGALRYAMYLLANPEEPGLMPDPQLYQHDAVPVGDASFWFMGRGDRQGLVTVPFFGLIDEASKLNLNTASQAMIEALPRMTPDLAAAIIDWRDADSEVSPGGAEDETYLRRRPPYKCKNGPFESIDELRLVFGMDLEILYGEDANHNGVLDPNENDGSNSPPNDNRDGRLDPGIAEYFTIYSRESNTKSDGSARVNISGTGTGAGGGGGGTGAGAGGGGAGGGRPGGGTGGGATAGQAQLAALLQEHFDTQRANEILQQAGGGGFRSTLEFFVRSRMTADEFAEIEAELTVTNAAFQDGLINVNTASAAVLACIPGIGPDKASELVSFRQSNPDKLTSVAWAAQVLEGDSAALAGPYLTGRAYQITADIAAVGQFGRGYRRIQYVLDVSSGAARVLSRQDFTHLGWALGRDVRQNLQAAARTGTQNRRSRGNML